MSGPELCIPILVREGNLNKDHQGRETRSVSIETTPYSDSEASPTAAGNVAASISLTSTLRVCTSGTPRLRPQMLIESGRAWEKKHVAPEHKGLGSMSVLYPSW